jgi:LysM repeat protein
LPKLLSGSTIIAVLIFPIIAYAGIFSFFNSVFNDDNKENIIKNSQNIELLQGNTSPITGPTGGGDILIVNNSALLPENSGFAQSENHANDQISIYVVREGDTLQTISKMFNVSINTIIWSNDNIKNGKVKPGESLVILPISGIQHTVKSGDSIESIARNYKADIDEIYSYNQLNKNSKLSAGDIVIVPDGEITTKKELTPKKAGSSGKSRNVRDYTSAPDYTGYYARPLTGGIKTQGIHGYNGVDIASTFGTNILASADGTVIVSKSSGWNGGYGSYIVIKHSNGTQTLYAHLSGVAVSVGDEVTQGQVIGYMGSTGKSTGTHLHFEIRGAKNPF